MNAKQKTQRLSHCNLFEALGVSFQLVLFSLSKYRNRKPLYQHSAFHQQVQLHPLQGQIDPFLSMEIYGCPIDYQSVQISKASRYLPVEEFRNKPCTGKNAKNRSTITEHLRIRLRWRVNYSIYQQWCEITSCCKFINNLLIWAKLKLVQMFPMSNDSWFQFLIGGWQRGFTWRAPKLAAWCVTETKLATWSGTRHHNVMRDLLCFTHVMRDLPVRFPR